MGNSQALPPVCSSGFAGVLLAQKVWIADSKLKRVLIIGMMDRSQQECSRLLGKTSQGTYGMVCLLMRIEDTNLIKTFPSQRVIPFHLNMSL